MAEIHPHISDREMMLLSTAPQVRVQTLRACQRKIFSLPELRKAILQESPFRVKVINIATRSCPKLITLPATLSSTYESLSISIIKHLALQFAKRPVTTEFTGIQARFLRKLWLSIPRKWRYA